MTCGIAPRGECLSYSGADPAAAATPTTGRSPADRPSDNRRRETADVVTVEIHAIAKPCVSHARARPAPAGRRAACRCPATAGPARTDRLPVADAPVRAPLPRPDRVHGRRGPARC